MVYESLRGLLTPEGEKNPNAWRKLLAGALSGAIAQTCTYPLYVVPWKVLKHYDFLGS